MKEKAWFWKRENQDDSVHCEKSFRPILEMRPDTLTA